MMGSLEKECRVKAGRVRFFRLWPQRRCWFNRLQDTEDQTVKKPKGRI